VNAPHPDVETLSDLAEGLLDPVRAAAVEAHATSCPTCASALAVVRSVPSLLAALPVPPLPVDVAARIDAVLSAESEHRQVGASAQEPVSSAGATVSSLPPVSSLPSVSSLPPAGAPRGDRRDDRRADRGADRQRRWRSVAAAAATVAVVAGGAALLAPQVSGPDGSSTSAAREEAADEAPGGAAAPPQDDSRGSTAGGSKKPQDGANAAQLRDRDARRLERLAGLALDAARAGPPAGWPQTAGVSVGLWAGIPAS